MDKYINEAFIGNDKVRITFNKKGKVLRILYPNPDHKQFINYLDFAIKIDGQILYLNDGQNRYNQEYINKTNILVTTVTNEEKEIKITMTDFCPINENVYIRNLEFENLKNENREIIVIVNSNAVSSMNYEISGYIKNDALIQYAKDYSMSIFSKTDIDKTKVNNMDGEIDPDKFDNHDYIGLSNMSAVSFKPFILKKKAKIDFPIFVLLNDNLENSVLNRLDTEIIRLKKNNIKDLKEKVKKENLRYVLKHSEHKLSIFSPKIRDIYVRSLLLFRILYNNISGGYSAAIEVDEEKKYSGRYSFSWPRDTFFALLGYSLLNYDTEIEKYYSEFLKKTQNRDGFWEQRFYTEGTLAPSWGYQVDETSAVISGAWYYYSVTKNIEFLKENFNVLEKAVKFLIKYTNGILDGKESLTYDIWETHKGENTYSLGSVFFALNSMLRIYNVVIDEYLKNRLRLEQIKSKKAKIEDILPKLKRHIYIEFYDEEMETFTRSNKDKSVDISSILLSSIFDVFSPREKKMKNTLEKIDEKLKTESGGYLRYEGDNYIGGKYPWPMGNLWVALQYIKLNNKEKALENFNFVVNTSSKLGFLGEQVDPEKMDIAWVNGLGWMHGLFIYVLDKLFEKGWLNG